METGKRTVILANGDFPAGAEALGALSGAARVVCCDGAAKALVERGMVPDAVVGDLDSIPGEIRGRLQGRIFRDPNQENNDLAKAFSFCMARGYGNIAILGATGKREDHTIGNISYFASFLEDAPDAVMITDFGIFSGLLPPGGKIEAEPGMQISLFAFDPQMRVSATGLRYPVENLAFPMWHTATLNEALSHEITLSFCGGPVLVYRAFGR